MGFLFNRKKRQPTIEELKQKKYVAMANEIVNKLGEEESEYSANLAMGGGYYYDQVYEGYGLRIVKPDFSRRDSSIYVEVDGERVMDYNNHTPGLWEELLKELYTKIPVILRERENNKNLLERKSEILRDLGWLTHYAGTKNITIDDETKVTSYDNYSGYDDEHYNGTTYYVYQNGEEVFCGAYVSVGDNKFYEYTPGDWEDKVKNALEEAKYEKEQQKIQARNNRTVENIKKLKKLR